MSWSVVLQKVGSLAQPLPQPQKMLSVFWPKPRRLLDVPDGFKRALS